MSEVKRFMVQLMAVLMIAPAGSFAANHRSAPISSLDHPAGITDWYAFVSYDSPSGANNVTMIMNVDPLLEPSNGPNYFPFDPGVVYTMKVDNTYDAVEDISFEFRFTTEIRAPRVPVALIGAGTGIAAPSNAPVAAIPPGTTSALVTGPVVPPAITALDGAGSAGLNLRQSYTVTLVQGATRTDLTPATSKLYAVPSNAGPRTMPCYTSIPVGSICSSTLVSQGIYSLSNGIKDRKSVV